MICQIYRSDSKPGLYIYLADGEKIEKLSSDLLKLIGRFTHVMELDLNSRNYLALVDIQTVKSSLQQQGYFLQLPKDPVKDVLRYK